MSFKIERIPMGMMMGGGQESKDPELQKVYAEARATLEKIKVGESFVITGIPKFARNRVYMCVYVRAMRKKIKISCMSHGLKESEMRVCRKE